MGFDCTHNIVVQKAYTVCLYDKFGKKLDCNLYMQLVKGDSF